MMQINLKTKPQREWKEQLKELGPVLFDVIMFYGTFGLGLYYGIIGKPNTCALYLIAAFVWARR